MDTDQDLTAANVVNDYPAERLAEVIKLFGEERHAKRVASAIVRNRPIETTARLAAVVSDAMPGASRRTGGHPARRTFQALRIEVNQELAALERVLPQAVDALSPGGRLVVLSYHSLEDRAVKRFMRDRAQDCVCPPDLPICRCDARATVRLLNRKAVTPAAEEIERNPRSSAAKLRAVEKLEPPDDAA